MLTEESHNIKHVVGQTIPNKKRGELMAKILEGKRRIIRLTTDEILNIIREYQQLTKKSCCYDHTREILNKNTIYIPEG